MQLITYIKCVVKARTSAQTDSDHTSLLIEEASECVRIIILGRVSHEVDVSICTTKMFPTNKLYITTTM
jgi:hypothetical protein